MDGVLVSDGATITDAVKIVDNVCIMGKIIVSGISSFSGWCMIRGNNYEIRNRTGWGRKYITEKNYQKLSVCHEDKAKDQEAV